MAGPISSRHMIATGLPALPLLRLHDRSERSLQAHAKEFHDELYRPILTNTPYGIIRQSFEMPGLEGEPVTIEFVHPFALLYEMSSKSAACSRFLKQHLGGSTCRVVLYIDETKPGNQLRPDTARAMECVYWSFLELPTWYRAKTDVGWLPFACVASKDAARIDGGLSALIGQFLKVFFSNVDGEPNLHRVGLRLACEAVCSLTRRGSRKLRA